ncbi:MAG: hypothetical protein L0287_33875 [Anaerolineae bacterium]|nr:hypothetical protein [Anaerolineae bacterium]
MPKTIITPTATPINPSNNGYGTLPARFAVPVGPTNNASEKSCIGRGLGAIRAQTINSEFLYFNLKYIEPFIASLGTGSTFTAINKNQHAAQVWQKGLEYKKR